jgi:bifunctional DNA-binding transcriptional regulator/antitoxin component of YhaV-PrlF toxin-antitoxin module
MILAKLSKNGQITLPKKYRDKVKAKYFFVTINGETCSFKPNTTKKTYSTDTIKTFPKKYKTVMEGLNAGMFNSQHKDITNLADEIDSIPFE